MFRFYKILLIYFLLFLVMNNSIWLSLWVLLIIFFINWEGERNLAVHFIRSQFFPGELTLLEYNIMVTFYVLGCVIKAKGIVTKEDIEYAEKLMNEFKIEPYSTSKMVVINSFNKGKVNTFDLNKVVAEFCSFFRDNPRAKYYFFDYQLTAAMKEGMLLPEELELLAKIAKQMGMSDYSFQQKIKSAQACYNFKKRFETNHQKNFYEHDKDSTTENQSENFHGSRESLNQIASLELRNSLNILGVTQQDDFNTVKRAFRLLINEYHPDKLASKDVPKIVMNKAKEKSQEIIWAYDLICKAKGWK